MDMLTEVANRSVYAEAPAVPETANVLSTHNLRRSVSGKALVDDISVEVQRSEVLAVVGPSGAGKSSFLRLLNRLDEPTGGTVLLGGEDYRAMQPRDLRRRVGMVMQTAYLFPGSVAANLVFGPQQRGQLLTNQQIAALLDQVELPGYQDRDVSTLSGGEAQRVSLARTLANEPEVLLLDEPTSALDDGSVRAIERIVLDLGPATPDGMRDCHPQSSPGGAHRRPHHGDANRQADRDRSDQGGVACSMSF